MLGQKSGCLEMKSVLSQIFRTKSVHSVTSDTNLHRCLGIIDLIVIGIGSMIGSGIYVMTGITAKEQAGPSIVISFLLASVVSLLVAACFTELAARLHKTGSTYLYLYLTVGELPATVAGISILLSTLLGGATNARTWSSYADFLFNSAISNFTKAHVGYWNVGPPLASYPDFVAVAVILVLTVVVALGVKCTARFSAIFVVINILVLGFVTVCGIVFGHISNWTSAEVGGVKSSFMPFGWAGVLSGAASCFWALSGFDMISCAVEESHSPERHIPLAVLLTMLIVTALYVGTSAGMTLLMPYQLLDTGAPLPSAFVYAGLNWGQYFVAIGPLCGFTATVVSSSYVFVRITLAMAEDGLLWSWFADVSECTHVPVLPVILCGLLQSVIACFCDIRDLISFSVSLLLLSYCATCMAVIVLRYSDVTLQQVADDAATADKDLNLSDSMHQNDIDAAAQSDVTSADLCALPQNSTDAINAAFEGSDIVSSTGTTYENGKETQETASAANISEDAPTRTTGSLLPTSNHSVDSRSLLKYRCFESFMICESHICIKAALALMLTSMLGLAFILVYGIVPLESGLWWSIVLVAVSACGVVFFMCIVCIHRQTLQSAVLKLPCVPLIPSLAIFACVTLLVANSTKVGWIGCLITFLIALIMYFSYSMRHSKLKHAAASCQSWVKDKQLDEVTTSLLRQQDDDDDDDDDDEQSSL